MSALLILCHATLSHAQDANSTSILLFGDSIIAGYGLNEEDSLAVQLERRLNDAGYAVDVINGGVSGDTTSAGRSRLAWMLGRHKPDIVLLALGGNDVLRGIAPAITRENLDAMLAELHRRNVTAILSAVRAPSNLGAAYQAELNAVYTDLAEQFRVPLYPFLIEKTFGQQSYMQEDGIHPNAQGIALIARDLADYLPAHFPVEAEKAQTK